MSKAEERAQAAYPAWRNGIGDEFSSNSAYYGFIKGYNQAEKDLELTWEEIYSILYFEREVLREFGNEEHSNEEVCKEVLKRFKDFKERKEDAKVNV